MSSWVRWDRWMRALHLYTSLFLAPWMVVYAVSAFCLNHNEWFRRAQLVPAFAQLSEDEFVAGTSFPEAPEAQAQALLRHLGLDGPHRLIGTPDANQLTLYRPCLRGSYRITWHTNRTRLRVEKQKPFSVYSFCNALHFQHGYQAGYWVSSVWAATVDAVTVSTVLWGVTGIYLWARRPSRRRLGGLCLAAGGVLFVALVVLLCR
jgi:hypothetical protein